MGDINESGGIGYDKAETDALKDQVEVDTVIIRAKNTEIEHLQDEIERLRGREEILLSGIAKALVHKANVNSCKHLTDTLAAL